MFKKNKEISNITSSLVLASYILIFHVILLGGLAILVLLFSGIVNYLFWIFLGGCLLISGSIYLFYRYMKKQGGAAFLEILSLPELNGKNVEVNLLGGLASFKIADDKNRSPMNNLPPVIDNEAVSSTRQLEDPDTRRLKELTELARLLEKNLITTEEYNHMKKSLLN